MSDAQPLVLITGASSGIGQALAERFHQAGYRLALVARRGDVINAWARSKGWAPSTWQAYSADVQNLPAMSETGRQCMANQGVPDIVIANAGISVGIDTRFAEDLDVMRRTFETNVLGMAATFQPFSCCHVRASLRNAGRGCEHGCHQRTSGARGVLRQQGGRCELLREPAGGNALAGSESGDSGAWLCRHAIDSPQPLSHAVFDVLQSICCACFSCNQAK